MSDQDARNQHEWEDRRNWIGGVIYRSTRDSRVMVPRPPKKWDVLFRQSGWTLNFGNRRSYLILLGLLSVPVGFLLLFVLLRFSK